jgi:hypothetical protein
MWDKEALADELDGRVAAVRAGNPQSSEWEVTRDVTVGILEDLADAFAIRAARQTQGGGGE